MPSDRLPLRLRLLGPPAVSLDDQPFALPRRQADHQNGQSTGDPDPAGDSDTVDVRVDVPDRYRPPRIETVPGTAAVVITRRYHGD